MNNLVLNILKDLSDSTKFAHLKKYIRESSPDIDIGEINFVKIDDKYFKVRIKDWVGRITFISAFSEPTKFVKYLTRKYKTLLEKEKESINPNDSRFTEKEIDIDKLVKCNSEPEVSELLSKDLSYLKVIVDRDRMRHEIDKDTKGLLQSILDKPTKGYWN